MANHCDPKCAFWVRDLQPPNQAIVGINTVALRYIQLFAIWCSTNSLPSCILNPLYPRLYQPSDSLQSQPSVRQHYSAALLEVTLGRNFSAISVSVNIPYIHTLMDKRVSI